MSSKLLHALGILALAVLAGVLIVQFLVSNPTVMYIYLALAVVCLAVDVVWVVHVFPGRGVILTGVLVLVAFVGGYLAMNAAFLSREEARELPAITRAENDPGDGHTVVLYFTHGEPLQYEPMPWIETMREFDQDKAVFIPFPFRPFFFYTFRSEYLQIGTSPHNQVHASIVDRLEGDIQSKLPGTKFALAFLDANPRPDEMIVRVINDGASRVVVMPVFVTVSSHTQAGQEMIETVGPEKYGVEVCYANPLWDSEPLQQSFVERTNAARGETDKAKIGVLLIGHGQPAAWDAIYTTQTGQENQFRESIKAKLVADGYSPENVVLSWMEFKEPLIEDGLHEMVANGVEKIIVFSTSISAKSIHSDIQVPKAIVAAKLPADIEVVDLGAWGDPDDALLIQAIEEKIAACTPEIALK